MRSQPYLARRDARIYDGVHYRFSTEVGAAMERKIGEAATAKFLR